MKYVLCFLIGALIYFVIDRIVLNKGFDKAYELGLKHAKDMYQRFPNNFIEAIDYLLDKNEEEE